MNTFKASDFDDLFGITPEQRTSVSQQPTDTQTTQLPAAEQQSFKVNPAAIKASDFDDILGITPEDRISATQRQKAIAEDSSDFIAGTKRGVQNLQASLYGATGLVGKGLQNIGAEETGKKLQDFGFEGYRRNIAEAAQTPAKYSFKDIYTGKAGIGGAIDWAQGTLGELVPSMVEAATGAVIGSFAAPGAGTVAGGLAGRTILKKSIDEAVGKLVKEGADVAVTNQVRKQVTNQALKKLGGKVGMGAAVMPMESGGMYADLFESHGVDAPETALLLGALSTSLEFLGGNSKLVDVFVDSLAKGAKGTAKKSAKEILSNIPEEALQEGGQELMNILNTVVNTDEKLLTLANVERIIESMAAGAVGGGFGSATNVVMDGKQLNKPSELDQKVDNIASGGVENIQKALNEFDRQDTFNTELLNNPEKLAAQAAEFGVTPERLSDNIGSQIMANKQLRERLNIELAKPVEESKKEKPLTDEALKVRIEDARKNHDALVAEQKNREQKINNFNTQVNRLSDILATTTDNNRKNLLREQIAGLIKSRNALVGQTEIANQEIKAYREFGAPKKSDELYAEKQRLYESIWTDRDKGVSPEEGIPVGIQPSYTDPEKSAVVSGAIINENYPQIEQKLIQLREDIANEYDYERRREMQKTYDELFVDYEQKKSAAESVNVFEKAGIDRGQVADLRDVEQVPLTDQQQVIVDQNNLKINDLNNQLNRTIDRDERISLLQQIDELDKVNAEIRTPIENVSQVGNELLGTDETSTFKNEQQVGTPEIDNNQYTEEPVNLETRSNIRQTKKLSLADISKIFPNQEVSQDETGKISVRFKNGKGATFQSIEDAGQGYIKFAIETGQMSKNGKILGITVESDVLLDANFADNQTLWHENKHVLDNLGLITKEDDNLLNAEFNRLRNAGKLRFALSTHEDPRQRMVENRANTFAQIMLDREAYRNKPLGKTIQRILDFFQQLLSLGQQSVAGLAREVESGKIYGRQPIEGNINDRLNADQIATTPEQIAQTIHPAIMYDGLMKGIPGVVDDLHNFTITLPDGKQPSFSVSGEVTADKVSEQLNKLMERFGQAPNFEMRSFAAFFSKLQQISDEKFGGMKAQSVEPFLLKQGVKKSEIEATGLREWLAAMKPTDKVTKEQLADFVRANTIEFEDVILGDEYEIDPEVAREFHELDRLSVTGGNLTEEQWRRKAELQRIVDKARDGKQTHFSAYTEPGAVPGSYREMFVTAPETMSEPKLAQKYPVRLIKYIKGKVEGLAYAESLEEAAIKAEKFKSYGYDQVDIERNVVKEKLIWYDGHSQYSEIKNPIIRIRFNEVEGPNGERILRVEEMQGPSSDNQKNMPKYLRDNIYQTGVKRILAYAKEHGFDGVALATKPGRSAGETQADRYSLEKQINSLAYYQNDDGTYGILTDAGVDRINGRSIASVREADLPAVVGKDVAEKMVRGAGKEETVMGNGGYVRAKTLSGVDLRSGGEGLKQLYDTDLPNIFKAWGGQKMGKVQTNNTTMPYISVAKAPSSYPMFQVQYQFKEVDPNSPAFLKWIGNSQITNPVYHGSPTEFDQFDKNRAGKNTNQPRTGLGFFFAMERNEAAGYAGPGGVNRAFYVRLENPRKMNASELPTFRNAEEAAAFAKRHQLAGYDGIVLKDEGHVIVFEPTQIKSAEKNTGDFSLTDPRINFQIQDLTTPEQKLSDEEYHRSFQQQNNLLQDIKQISRMRLHDVKLLADKSMGSISTRLKNVSPLLSSKLRILDFTTSQKIVKALREAKPILEATKGMSKEDKFVWDLARKNADAGKVQQLATKYGILENIQTLRNTLNNIRKEAEEVGYDVGFLDEYWPRIIKDTEGFLQATQEISEQPVFSNAIKEKAKAMGLTVEKFNNEYPEVKADIISNLILGRGMGIGGPGNIQSRVYDTIPRELEQYYMDSDAALMQYIYSMTKKIEVRKFFGKVPERIMKLKTAKKNKQTELIKLQELARLNPAEAEINAEKIEQLQEDIARIDEPLEQYKHRRDYTENIGTYIDDLMMAGILNKKDEKMVRDILDARFHEYGTHGPINAYKNFSYIDVMGSPISAITQIGDLAWAMYVGKVWSPSGFSNTIKNIINATFNKSNITKEDLGIERIAQEFADGTTLSNAVSWVFNMTGLSKIDSIGKEALINNALDQYKRQVQSEAGRTKLISDIRATFGPQSESVIQDLLTNNNSDNVKMLLYSRLLDFQPVALSEMPEYYLKAGNGRVFYMLKTYTLKQMDVFRKEVWHTMKNGDAQQKLEGIKNLVQLMSLLTLANAGADEIKDWLLGKESKFKDHVIENFLTMGGASRYMRMQTTQDGLGSTLAGKILPPFKFINSLSKDVIQGYKDYVSGDTSNLTDSRVLESVPIAGKLLYWHMGRGAEYKESIAEQEFKKAGKAANLFKKQLENSKDKRLFLQANLNDFRQMKLHENSQSSLNKVQATINKLEKMEQTTNVVKRIGQLNNHKERIMTDYLKRVEGLTAQ